MPDPGQSSAGGPPPAQSQTTTTTTTVVTTGKPQEPVVHVDPVKLKKAEETVAKLSPDAAKTLDAISAAYSGDFAKAKADLEGTTGDENLKGKAKEWVDGQRTAAETNMTAGNKQAAISAMMDVFNSELAAGALSKISGFKTMNPNAHKEVDGVMTDFAGPQAAQQVEGLNKINNDLSNPLLNPMIRAQESSQAKGVIDALAGSLDSAVNAVTVDRPDSPGVPMVKSSRAISH